MRTSSPSDRSSRARHLTGTRNALLTLFAFAALVPASTSSAKHRAHPEVGDPGALEHYPDPFGDYRPGEELVFTQGWDLIVVTVTGADTGGTRAHPPAVQVHVDRTLQGKVHRGAWDVRWMPEGLNLWCPVGEEETIARWCASAYPPPRVGSRWILGGERAGAGPGWLSYERARWEYTDSTLAQLQAAAREWRPKVKALRRQHEARYGPELRAARLAEERRRHAEDSTQYVNDRAWLARARRAARGADLASLVNRSDYIVEGTISLSGYSPPGRQLATLHVARRLRWNGQMRPGDPLPIRITPREDSVGRFWLHAPYDLQPGPEPGSELRCVVFATRCVMPDRDAYPTPCLRLVDGEHGILLAEDALRARLQRVLWELPETSLAGGERPSATWRDFASLTPAELDGAGIKLSPLHRMPSRMMPDCPLVLGSTSDSTTERHPFLTEWFWNRALPDSLYRMEYEGVSWQLPMRRDEMAQLLDSLTTLPRVHERWVSPTDSFSLTLRRDVGGRELWLECTLDRETQARLANMLLIASMTNAKGEPIVPGRRPSDQVRWNVPGWVDTRWAGSVKRFKADHGIPEPPPRYGPYWRPLPGTDRGLAW